MRWDLIYFPEEVQFSLDIHQSVIDTHPKYPVIQICSEPFQDYDIKSQSK